MVVVLYDNFEDMFKNEDANMELDTINLPDVSVITTKSMELKAEIDMPKVEPSPKESGLDFVLSGLLTDLVGEPVDKKGINQL